MEAARKRACARDERFTVILCCDAGEEEAEEQYEGDEGREDNDVNGSDASGETNTPESSDSEPHPIACKYCVR
jgi:hypothetical protein